MIVTEGPQQYRLITQNDHGDLAGQFAAHWGNDRFARLNPYPSMVLAAEAHDNGWWHWDVNPSVDDEGVPLAPNRGRFHAVRRRAAAASRGRSSRHGPHGQ